MKSRGLLLTILLASSLSVRAYVDITPTLGRIINESRSISIIQVEKVNREKRGIIFTKVEDLVGQLPNQTIRHQLTDGNPPRPPRHLLDWARPGQRAILFVTGPVALVCVGDTWYQTTAPAGDDQWWRMTLDRPELALAYRGSARRLADAVKQIAAGKEVIITTVAHGAQGRGSFSDVVFNTLQSGAPAPMQRMRASRNMPAILIGMGADPQWFVGFGAVTADDLPRLEKDLQSPDPQARLEAADDLRLLGPGIAANNIAQSALEHQLTDSDPQVRLHIATTLLTINPKQTQSHDLLAAALSDPAIPVKLEAARCIARLGKLAEPLLPALIQSLDKETDPDIRYAIVEAIGQLGPVAATAIPRLVTLLDDPNLQPCAAETLGRIGQPAQSTLPALAKLLDSPQPEIQWAAARAMVLIGGPNAKPVVPFLIARLNKAPRGRELYQLTWLLGLLGPVADEAVDPLETARIRDNELATMAIWAIRPREKFPWELGYRADRDCDLWLFADYIDRMGEDRTKAPALDLMDAFLNNRTGWVPTWGFHLLAARAEFTVPPLIEYLKSAPATQKVRAAKLLGLIGPAAEKAKPTLEAATNSPDSSLAYAAKIALERINAHSAE
jgi:HEAT repeat protein